MRRLAKEAKVGGSNPTSPPAEIPRDGVVSQRVLEGARQIALADPRRLSSVRAQRLGRRGHRIAEVQQQQRAHRRHVRTLMRAPLVSICA